MPDPVTRTRCCIVGGGPAGMMLGTLLARAGVDTTVLEKHRDFLRDFRGDTVHPSTLRIVDELGLLDAFMQVPHQKLHRLSGLFGDERVAIADFGGLPERYGFIAFMPQWDFLDFLAAEGRQLRHLKVVMQARVDSLIEDDGGRVAGVRGTSADGDFELRAALTIGCDGRHSVVREAAGLPLEDIGAPIDVLWFRVGRDGAAFDDTLMRITPGRMIVTIDRGSYWQCAFVIAKGEADVLRGHGIEAFRGAVAQAAPVLAGHVGDIASWSDVKLLSVSIDRLTAWSKPGLLCIGDAAHAMSPVGGVGINLAIQDAVATANALWAALLGEGAGVGNATDTDNDTYVDTAADLAAIDARLDDVRRRRLFPTRVTQAMQVQVQTRLLAPLIGGGGAALAPPLMLRMLSASPPLQRLFARVIGLGVRPEHVRSPAEAPRAAP